MHDIDSSCKQMQTATKTAEKFATGYRILAYNKSFTYENAGLT